MFTYSLVISKVKVLREISKELGFQFDLERPSDGELWGFDLGNGTFTGLAGDIQFSRRDIGFVNLFLRGIYLDMMEFTYPHDYDTFCFLVIICSWIHIAIKKKFLHFWQLYSSDKFIYVDVKRNLLNIWLRYLFIDKQPKVHLDWSFIFLYSIGISIDDFPYMCPSFRKLILVF